MELPFKPEDWTQEELIHQFFQWYDYDQHYGGVKENLISLRRHIHHIPIPESIPALENLSQEQIIGLFFSYWYVSLSDKKIQKDLHEIRQKIQIETQTGIASYKVCKTCSNEISSKQIFCEKCENDFLWKRF